jgi:uncharacterized repeat protein (TIGR03833 family)
MTGKNRRDIKVGIEVDIVMKKDQRSGKLTRGIVKDILTRSADHPHGIKVRLTGGQVGRVKVRLTGGQVGRVKKVWPGPGSAATIRQCSERDFEMIYSIINEAAQVYKGVIPGDRWKVPYMSKDELKHEIDAGVVFWGFEEDRRLIGVMGIQHVQDVTLIRHAYVRLQKQHRGIGNGFPKRKRTDCLKNTGRFRRARSQLRLSLQTQNGSISQTKAILPDA